MTVTIKDVARKAGVSTATVSRILNNIGPANEETIHRVKAVAKDLRYIPSALGRNLSRQKTEALGLLLPDLFGEFFSEVIRGADQTAQANFYHLVVSSSHNNKREIEAALKMMRGRVDGLVVMSPHLDANALKMNLPQSLPFVLLNCHLQGEDFDALSIDNYSGARKMTEHLIRHGHKRIGAISGTPGNLDAEDRLRGYRDAMRDAGIPVEPAFIVHGSFSEASGYEAARRLMTLDPKPSALFASNDAMAIGALSALREVGLNVPEDMALAGFDDIPIGKYLTPPLTSVEVDIYNLGVLAIETLLHAVTHRNTHHKRQTILPTTLRVRESCGCLRQH